MCGFGSQVGKQHQRNRLPALLEPCEPVVGKSGGSGQPQLRENWFCRHSREVDARNCGKAEKKKQTQLGLQRQRIEAQDDLDGKGCFSPRRGRGWGESWAAHITQTLTNKTEV